MLMRLRLWLTPLVLLIFAPVPAQSAGQGVGPVVNVPAGGYREILVCQFGTEGLRVQRFYYRGSPDRGPQPGDPCLLFLARAATMGTPPGLGPYPAQIGARVPASSATQTASAAWGYYYSKDGQIVGLITCTPDADSGRLMVSGWAHLATEEGEPGTAPPGGPLGEDCLEVLHLRVAGPGLRLNGPIIVDLGDGTAVPGARIAGGLVFLLIPQPGSAGQAKAIRCDRDASGGFRTTYVERGAELKPDETAPGQPCLSALAQEQGLRGSSGGARLNLVGPLPAAADPPDDDGGDEVIFVFADGSDIGSGGSSTCCACVPVCACGFCP